MFCFHYFIFFWIFTYQILQLNAFDEEQNDIFAELWKNEGIGTKSDKCEETLRTNSNDNLISQKNGKIKKEIVVKDEPNDYEEFDQFSNERQQKIALNKTVKEENVEERVKSEFMEFDRISDKEEFDNEKDGEEQSTDSYSLFDNSNLKESFSKSQKGVKKKYLEIEKQEIIAEFDQIKNKFKTRAEGMSYDVKKIDEKIGKKLGVSRKTIFNWKSKFGVPKKQNRHIDAERVKITAEFANLKEEFKTRAEGMSYDVKKVDEKIAQKLGVSRKTIFNWKSKFGVPKKQNRHIDADTMKREIIMKYENLKNKFVSPKAMRKINEKIEQKLGLPVIKIYNWKNALGISKELKMTREEEENEKWKIIKKFNKMKDEYVQKNDHYLSGKEIEEKIAKKLGFNRQTICKWKRKRGIYQIKNYTDAEKVELLKNFNIIKKENPQLRNDEIAQMLNISIRTLYSWKRKSKDSKPVNNGGPIDNVQRHGGFERSTSFANSLNDVPWKWNDFGKKRNERIGKILNKC